MVHLAPHGLILCGLISGLGHKTTEFVADTTCHRCLAELPTKVYVVERTFMGRVRENVEISRREPDLSYDNGRIVRQYDSWSAYSQAEHADYLAYLAERR